jgi:hypothetical protein
MVFFKKWTDGKLKERKRLVISREIHKRLRVLILSLKLIPNL